MGGITPVGIRNVEVTESDSGDEKSAIFTASNKSTCTLSVKVATETVLVSLRDCISEDDLDVEVVRHENGLKVNYTGGLFDIIGNRENRTFFVGLPKLLYGFLFVSKHNTGPTRGDTLFVSFMFGTPRLQQIYSLQFQVWWDSGEGKFVHNMEDPTKHSTRLEALLALAKAYPASGAVPNPFTSHQTTKAGGHITNNGASVIGDYNNSINNFFQNICNNYLNN